MCYIVLMAGTKGFVDGLFAEFAAVCAGEWPSVEAVESLSEVGGDEEPGLCAGDSGGG